VSDAPKSSWLRFLPVAIFLALASAFAFALSTGDPSKLPSALIGKPAPQSEFPAVEGLATDSGNVPGFSTADLAIGKVSVINFWASWCGPCTDEHPLLVELAQDKSINVFGVNYKDSATNARRFLGRYGNPFTAIGTDLTGRTAIEWGVYGMPETFVVDGNGKIAYKYVGPITPEGLRDRLMPEIKKAAASPPPPSASNTASP
jgi:cytochrome c biogenesis protein CcmG, thiol:disulfide interchange protein DsbE